MNRILLRMVGVRLHPPRSTPRLLLAAMALSLYAVLVAVTPALHHDLACHVKSPGHCDACMANPLASRVEAGTGLGAPPPEQVGEIPSRVMARHDVVTPAPTRGRAPPA